MYSGPELIQTFEYPAASIIQTECSIKILLKVCVLLECVNVDVGVTII